MKKRIRLALLLATVVFFSACAGSGPNAYNIIPLPQEMTPMEGKFKITETTTIVIPAGREDFKLAADFLAQRMAAASGMKLAVVEGDGAEVSNSIVFKQSDNSDLGKEGYTLSVKTGGIIVEAAAGNGAFYAVQSIIQLLPPQILAPDTQSALWAVPCVEIKDKPRYSYRGLHLDVSRHFYSLQFVKRYIDMLALHKMNTFHWHLTDDQGWRIEIKGHPKLTEIGSKRKETLVGCYYDEYPQVFDGKPYGGFYTQEEAKEIIEYARQRFITVIPEIEMPGHALAALSAYPELSCTGKQYDAATKWGIFPEVFCPKEETFKFLEEVLAEVIDLFPSEYIHIGGDECPKAHWKECKHCQALMKKEKLKNEDELQSYFTRRMEKYISSKGRKLIGWDEIIDGGLPEEATVMSWRGVKGGVTAAQQKHHVVMSPVGYCYLDYNQYDPYIEPMTIGNFLTLEKTYSYEPTPEELTPEEQQYILGVQGNMWNEYSYTEKDVERKAYPRAFALAEVGWTNKDRKDYLDFAKRLKGYMKHLDMINLGYSKTMFDVLAAPEYKADKKQLVVKLSSQYLPNGLRYTVDGSTPTDKSLSYTDPIDIKGRVVIKSGVFENGKLVGNIFEHEYVGHNALGADCTLEDGTTSLLPVDGLRASIYENPGWYAKPRNTLKSDGGDLHFTIDLKQAQPVKRITAGLINQPLYRVVAPTEMLIAYSEDGQTFTELPAAKIENKEPRNRRNVEGGMDCNINARYLKVSLKNAGSPFPAGSSHEGKPSVILLDELIVE